MYAEGEETGANAKVSPAPKPKSLIGRRHGQAIFLYISFAVAYLQRVNISVGLVAMTDVTNQQGYPILNYTTSQKGVISSVFFYGYLVTGPIAGVLCDKYGAIKLLSIMGGLLCGLLTIAVPIAATKISGIWAFCTLRVLQGLAQGIFLPAINAHLANWVIPEERGQFAWVMSGGQVGTIVMMAFGGVIASSPGGWPAIYYFSGSLSFVMGICGLLFGSKSPKTDKRISEEERNYIVSHLKAKTDDKIKIPWRYILTSRPVWVLVQAHLCNNWGFFTLLTLLPTYIHGVYGFQLSENGLLSALPYIGMMLTGLLVSPLASIFADKRSVNFNRKFWNSIGFYGSALALLCLSILNTQATGAIILLTIATSANSGVLAGFMSNHMDLSPNLAGVLMGITNGLSNFGSIIAPALATLIVKDEGNVSQWQTVFLISAALYGTGNTIYLFFGITELQPWNDCSVKAIGDSSNNGEDVEKNAQHDRINA